MIERIDRTERRVQVDLARHVNAIFESMSTQSSASDEKYADLPERVSRLEVTVHDPERR